MAASIPASPLAPQIAALLALFRDGKYQLTYRAAVPISDVVEFEDVSNLLNHRDYFYPFDTLVTTRPYSSLDLSRVEYYRGRIRSGVRPVVIAVGGGYAELVLDGHHKLAAYRAEGANAAILTIQPEEPPPLAPEVARHAFAEAPQCVDDYLRLKSQYDHS